MSAPHTFGFVLVFTSETSIPFSLLLSTGQAVRPFATGRLLTQGNESSTRKRRGQVEPTWRDANEFDSRTTRRRRLEDVEMFKAYRDFVQATGAGVSAPLRSDPRNHIRQVQRQ